MSKLYSGQVNGYMLIKYEEEHYTSFRCQEGSWIKIRKIYDTKVIILERTMHLAIILLLVKCRFQNHWSNGKHNAKYGQ